MSHTERKIIIYNLKRSTKNCGDKPKTILIDGALFTLGFPFHLYNIKKKLPGYTSFFETNSTWDYKFIYSLRQQH